MKLLYGRTDDDEEDAFVKKTEMSRKKRRTESERGASYAWSAQRTDKGANKTENERKNNFHKKLLTFERERNLSFAC